MAYDTDDQKYEQKRRRNQQKFRKGDWYPRGKRGHHGTDPYADSIVNGVRHRTALMDHLIHDQRADKQNEQNGRPYRDRSAHRIPYFFHHIKKFSSLGLETDHLLYIVT